MPPAPAPARFAALSPVCRIGARRRTPRVDDIRPCIARPGLTAPSAPAARLGSLAPLLRQQRSPAPRQARSPSLRTARPGMPAILLADRHTQRLVASAPPWRANSSSSARATAAPRSRRWPAAATGLRSSAWTCRRSAGWRPFAASPQYVWSDRRCCWRSVQPTTFASRLWHPWLRRRDPAPCPARPVSCCGGSGGCSTARWSGAGSGCRRCPVGGVLRHAACSADRRRGARRRRGRRAERAPGSHVVDVLCARLMGDVLVGLRAHHDYTFAHSFRVATHLATFALAVGMRRADAELLAQAGLLHDIGKTAIPVAILDKPGPLDSSEWPVVRRHPQVAAEVLGARRPCRPIWSASRCGTMSVSTAPATRTASPVPRSTSPACSARSPTCTPP